MSASFQQVIIIGRLGKDPVVRYTQNQTPIAELSVATSKTITNKQTGEKTEKTEWHRCKAFGKTAEIAGQYLQKGGQVNIIGELETSKYKDQQTGQDRYSTEIKVNQLNMLGSAQGQNQGQQQQAQQAPNGFNGQSQGGGYQNQPNGNQPPQQGYNGGQQPQQPMQNQSNSVAPNQPQNGYNQNQPNPNQGGFNQPNSGFGQ